MRFTYAKHLTKYRKLLPTRDLGYHFLSNLLLLVITLAVGNYYITNKLQETDRTKTQQQHLIEQQTDFVKTFTELGQDMIYHAERYYYNYGSDESPEFQAQLWQDYMTTVEAWNRKNLLHPIFIKEYYGKDMQHEFYTNLLPKLVAMHESLHKIRDGERVGNMEQVIENAKHELFIFSEKMIVAQNNLN